MAFHAAAEDTARLGGVIKSPQENGLRGVEVQVQNELTGSRWKTYSDEDGRYQFAGLPPGTFRVRARMPGFRTVARSGVAVAAAGSISIDFRLEMITLHETITIVSGVDEIDSASGDTLVLSRDARGSELPANGGDFRTSFDLMPGVVITPAGVSDAGQFTSEGQRPNANTFRVDGVSANTGVGGSTLPGSFPGASLPAMNATGTTGNLVSSESTQSVELRTSNFAPEFGERPGSLVSIQTRPGSPEFHGSVSLQARHNGWTANDWFANSRGLSFPRSMYGNVNGVLGGPIIRNRTFFFVSGEASALRDAGIQLTSVPSLSVRRNAPDAVVSLLESVPLPTGPDLENGQAEGLVAMSRYAMAKNVSGRIDHALGATAHLFGRYNWAPSMSRAQRFPLMQGEFGWQSVTAGGTFGKGTIHDIRFNYSRADFYAGKDGRNRTVLFGPGTGLIAVTYDFFDAAGGPGALSIPNAGNFVWGDWGRTRQDQWEARYSLSRVGGNHQFRAGIQYLLLSPWRENNRQIALGSAPSLQSILDGTPIKLQLFAPGWSRPVHIGSVFLQDTFRVSDSLQLVYGARWEVTPPVQRTIGQLSSLALYGDLSGDQNIGWLAGTSSRASTPWAANYRQFAPRIGIAYRLPGSAVLRAGAGLFYDTRLGAAIHPINGAPFNSWWLSPGSGTGLGGGHGSGGVAPLPSSYDVQQFVDGPYAGLRLPVSYQWRVTLERALRGNGIASIAYAGAAGRNLLGNQIYFDPDTGSQRQFVTQTQNRSSYQAMQVRYAGNLSRRVYGSIAYTWSHSLDDASQDSSSFLIHPNYSLREAWASSNFDVRQTFTAALSYRVPASSRLPWSLSDWTISGIFRLRSGFPVNIVNQEQPMGRTFVNWDRPDYVFGQPLWIADGNAAGGRRLNRDAFQATPGDRAGTLGRNAVRGNSLGQIDVSLRRDFAIHRSTLQLGLSVFNLLNHPSFADPIPYLASPWFGQSTSMQNLMLGTGSPNSGLPAMFQAGGSRSAEISVRVTF